jgi:NAD(P)-dependent dehydrogenase (short-subunit alcohol dehydrogenase family)
MTTSLAGRTALITGASSGLGAHFARVLSGAGANVVLGARRLDRVEALARELDSPTAGALAVRMDVTDEASVVAAYDAAEARFGLVNSIVANAGMTAADWAIRLPYEKLRALTDTNFIGVYLTVREGAKRLIAAGRPDCERGRIIIIGSVAADLSTSVDAAYGASKAAVAHLGRNLAREWARKGINVNIIQPGYVETEINQSGMEFEVGKQFIAATPRGRVVDIQSFDPTVLYLASDASAQMTGAVINVDDGQSL